MGHIEWHDKYKIGVDFIDKEHMTLFLAMDKLLKISENEEKSEWVCREGVKYLKNHTMEHFEHEEEYMLTLIHITEPTRLRCESRKPASA